MKKSIEISNLEYGELFKIDVDKSILKIPRLIAEKSDMENARRSIQILKLFATQNGHEKIAINI